MSRLDVLTHDTKLGRVGERRTERRNCIGTNREADFPLNFLGRYGIIKRRMNA
jgi:hypothetical protein